MRVQTQKKNFIKINSNFLLEIKILFEQKKIKLLLFFIN